METNAMNIENVQTWLDDPKFNHIKSLQNDQEKGLTRP
jgi:hypothetical protein